MGCGASTPGDPEGASQDARTVKFSEPDSAQHQRESVRFVLVLGTPGLDTATQCSKLASTHSCVAISVGDMMRREIDAQSTTGMAVAEMVERGKIVPSHMTIDVLKGVIAKHPRATFVLDGFPRTVDAFSLLIETLGAPAFALVLERSEEEAVAAAQADGMEESIRRQMLVYQHQTRPVIEMLRGKGVPVKVVEVRGSAEETFKAASKAFTVKK